MTDMTPEQIKEYNARRSRMSYEKNKQLISNRRIMKNVMKGTMSAERCQQLIQSDRNWTAEQLQMLQAAHAKYAQMKLVHDVPQKDFQRISSLVSKESKGFFQLEPKDENSEAFVITKQNSKNKRVSLQDCHQAYTYLYNHNLLMKSDRPKSDQQQLISLQRYQSRFSTLFSVYGTDNLLDMYQNPERVHNKLVTSHLSMGSVKEYLSVLISLYRRSPLIDRDIFPDLSRIVHKDQIQKLGKFMKNGIKLSKATDTFKFYTEAYYDWTDIKLILKLVKTNHKQTARFSNLRDQLILQFYIKESVLRDNLGNVKVVYDSTREQYVPTDPVENVFFVNEGTLLFRDFKTNNVYDPLLVHISKETQQIVDSYFAEYRTLFNSDPPFLITKNDGQEYTKGKLSRYINHMFQRQAGVSDFSINDLRHSMATFHRYSPVAVKNYIAKMMQHSFGQHLLYERHNQNISQFAELTEDKKVYFENIKRQQTLPLLDETCLFVSNFTENTNTPQVLKMGTLKQNEDGATKNTHEYVIVPNDISLNSFVVSKNDEKARFFIL